MDAGELNLVDRAVYQATRQIFVDEKAKTRDLKAVKKYIKKYTGDRSSVLQLVSQLGAGAVHRSILRLLSSGVYESSFVARQCFPDPFEPSIALIDAGTQLDEEVMITKQASPKDLAQPHDDDSQDGTDSTEATMVQSCINDRSTRNSVDNSSVLPVYLPFPAEHMLMEKLQRILELACYQFGLKALPNVMQKQGWDCPESVELTKWLKVFGRKGNIAIWQENGKPSKELLHSIATIRHAAVHRLRADSARLERLLTDAERLAVVLGNDTFTQAISELRLETHATLTELIQKKQSTHLQYEKVQEEITRQRAELDQKEREIMRGMASQDKKHCELAGARLEKVLHLMGELRITSDDQGAVLESVNAIEHNALTNNISDFDDEEQFEDCNKA